MKFSTITAATLCAVVATAAPAGGWGSWDNKSPFQFTSVYSVKATPDQVVNGTTNPTFTGGLPGAVGYYDFGINSYTNTICYNITLYGFKGKYQSAALTATHIHEAVRGQNGPPRIAFPDPVGDEKYANSVGCIKGPFKTGINATGTMTDTGSAFNVKQIEQNPAGFFADVHSSLAVPGAVRGQIA